MNKGGIFSLYKISSHLVGRIYIGVTGRDVAVRLKEHNRKSSSAISKTIRKHGLGNFKIETLAVGRRGYILDLEHKAVIAFGSSINEKGLNLISGGGGAFNHTDEAKNKISAGAKWARPPELCKQISERLNGHSVSSETKKKISMKLKGGTRSSDAIKKQAATNAAKSDYEKQLISENRSKAYKGRRYVNRRGAPCSEEKKRKISEALKRRNKSGG